MHRAALLLEGGALNGLGANLDARASGHIAFTNDSIMLDEVTGQRRALLRSSRRPPAVSPFISSGTIDFTSDTWRSARQRQASTRCRSTRRRCAILAWTIGITLRRALDCAFRWQWCS